MNKKPTKQKQMTSGFWLNQDFIDRISEKGNGKDAVALAGYKRAVSNFVRIVTGENIPVKFSSNNQSYTNGKVVTISTSSDPKDFDSNVGLALHEGSHIKLTNFDTLKYLTDTLARAEYDHIVLPMIEKYSQADRWDACQYVAYRLKDIINVVEDRRIDNFVYRTAPGYRGYYNALYDKYFNHKIIDKGLQSTEYRTEDWDSYMFRLINITNPNRDLTALKGLQEIWDVLDLDNIDRLQSTDDALNVAVRIFQIIESNIPKPEAKEDQEQEGGEEQGGQGKGQGQGGKQPKAETREDDDDDGSGSDGEDSHDTGEDNYKGGSKGNQDGQDEGDGYDDEGDEDGDELELTDKQKDQLRKIMRQQEDFLQGRVKKKNSNKKLDNTVEALDTGDVDTVDVDAGPFKKSVIVVRNVTPNMIQNVECGMWWRSKNAVNGCSSMAVKEGMILGTLLGKRLKVRAESRDTKFNRLRSGKIDKRMIASAGFGHEGIFQKLETFSYTPSIIHISIDNSGSMGGDKMHQAVKTATAIAKACSMIENMDCVISYRCDTHFAGTYRDSPLMVVAYDSRKHKLVQFNQVVQYIGTGGTTPEGLCFDAVMDEIIKDAKGKDAYFLNFSDGEPYSGSYYGQIAFDHTRKQVQKMIANSIKVISYFIGHAGGSSKNNFVHMYGKDATFIDVNSVTEVSKTMNKKFLEVV